MKVKILGWRDSELSIVNRLEEGFQELDHEICGPSEVPELLIAINPDVYTQAIDHPVATGGIKIFNVLDVPEHLIDSPHVDYPLEDIKKQLKHADAVTSISNFTKKQAKKYYKINSTVVYTAALEIEKVPKYRDIDFLYVGRASDPNKRFGLIVNALIEAGMSHSNLVVCGPEPTSHGVYKGRVTKSQLNELYHQAKIVLLPSRIEGVGLSMIEGALAGAIPLTCNDNHTVKEFGLQEFSCEPNPTEYGRKMMLTLMSHAYDSNYIKKIAEKNDLSNKFNKQVVAQKYLDLYENRTNSIGV